MNSIMYRYELKYFITNTDSAFLTNALSTFLPKDIHGNDGKYLVRSLYFDDFKKSGVFEKQSGIFDRHKFRIRHYDHAHNFFKLERKSRVRDLIQKQATKISLSELNALQSGFIPPQCSRRDDNLFNLFNFHLQSRPLTPSFIVEYRRAAWRSLDSDFSITIDSDIRSCVYEKNLLARNVTGVPIVDKNLNVLELKFFRDFPSFVNGLLSGCCIERVALSKYVAATKYTKTFGWEDQ